VATPVPVLPVRVPVLVAGILAALTSAVPNLLFADQVVYFVNGKAMMVKSVEKGPKFCVLEIDGGGKVGVPTEQIDRIEEYQVQPAGVALPQPAAAIPAPAIIAPPSAPAAAPGAPPPAAQLPAALTQGAVSAPPPAPLPSGPGFGGRVDLSPQANLGSLNPLPIGGDRSAPAPVRPMAAQGMRMGGPGGGFGANRLQNQGGPGRPGFPPAGAGGRFGGKGGMGARQRIGGMTAEQTPAPQQPAPQSAPPPQSAQPAATPPPSPPPEESETPPDPPSASTSDDGSSSGDEASADQGSS